MSRASVTFRGEERDVVIDRASGYDPETNASEIEWHFDGLSPAEHDALAITDDEEQSIFEQIATCLDERSGDD